MKQSFFNRYGVVLTHVLMWALLANLLLVWQPLGWRINIPIEFWYKQGLILLFLIAIYYINSLYWVPQLLHRGRYLPFFILNIAITLLGAYLVQSFEVAINLREYMDGAFRAAREGGAMKRESNMDNFALLAGVLVLGISVNVSTFQNWQKSRQVKEQLENERVKSELSFLKSQINPHFFFNTLNNIYALIPVNNEAAGEAIHKLSRMMRYVLYETEQEKVLLSQEIAFIDDYILLMKLRLTNNVAIEFVKPMVLKDLNVAPMIMLPLVENAFKHGVSTKFPSRIHLELSQSPTELTFSVSNTIFAERSTKLNESSGIGLVNTRRRLDLLYPNGHSLKTYIDTKKKTYFAELKLKP